MNEITQYKVRVTPTEGMNILSQDEVSRLKEESKTGMYDLFRRCTMAVLNSGIDEDDPDVLLARNRDFDVRVIQQDRGIKLELINAPADAFVDGVLIEGIRELLFDVLRDIVFVNKEIRDGHFNLIQQQRHHRGRVLDPPPRGRNEGWTGTQSDRLLGWSLHQSGRIPVHQAGWL